HPLSYLLYLLHALFSTPRRPPISTLFPYTTLFRSTDARARQGGDQGLAREAGPVRVQPRPELPRQGPLRVGRARVPGSVRDRPPRPSLGAARPRRGRRVLAFRHDARRPRFARPLRRAARVARIVATTGGDRHGDAPAADRPHSSRRRPARLHHGR